LNRQAVSLAQIPIGAKPSLSLLPIIDIAQVRGKLPVSAKPFAIDSVTEVLTDFSAIAEAAKAFLLRTAASGYQ
jgi:hypothetical protein